MQARRRPRDAEAIDLAAQPGHLIRRLQQIAVAIFLQETGPLGVTPVQYAALQAVANAPGIDQRTLARTIGYDTSTIASVIDRLESRGWLTRNPAPEDRRLRRLVLTREGEALVREAAPGMLQAQARILAPLTARERAQFMKMLGRLVEANKEHSRAPSED